MSRRVIVETKGLVKTYRKGTNEIRPLDGLDLEVREGELLALMGPSGSGKSTLLHLIGGLDHADSGSCRVGGVDLGELSEKQLCAFRAEKIGFVFQTFNLIPILTAAENVDLPLRLLPLSSLRRQEQVATALEIVGLSARADHLPSELSGGEEQRVAIARAFATDPEIIIADEPTGDLDEDTSAEIMEVLTTLSSEYGKTVLMVTHDASNAERADRTLYFEHGRLTDTDPRQRSRGATKS
jgi:putative ABC transport system ATP-binding protein